MENILGGTEMKRKIISIMLSIAIVITGIQLPVIKKAVLAKENVLNKFDAYYTAHSDNVKDYPAKKVIKSDYWEEDGAGVITRTAKDTTTETNSQNPNYDGNPYPDMAMLYYNIKQYKDFTVEVEYKNPNKGRGAAWLGFGGKVTDDTANTWCTENGATIFGTSGEKTVKLIGTYIPWQKSNKGAKTDGSTLWDTDISGADWGTEWNAVKIIVKDGVINFYTKVGSEWKAAWGDDKFYYGDWYKGGYIFLASNNAGTQFRNFKIEEIKDTNILKNFNGYYTEDTKGNSSVADVVSKEKYWTEDENGILTRTSKNTTANVGDAYKNMAYLFYNVKEYEEFSLEVDYKNADPKKGGAWVGFDGKIEDDVAKTWFGDGQGTMIAANGKNEVNLVGTFGNGDKPKITTYNTTKRVWKTEVEGADWTKAEWKTIKIEVKKGKINFQIKNNGKWYTVYEKEELLYDTWYDGGYIFLASNHAGTQFKNFKLTEYKESEEFRELKKFESYYAKDIYNAEPVPAFTKDYWTENQDGIITRKTKDVGTENDGNPYPNMALLYYNVSQYKDFTLEVEIKNPIKGKASAWVGFDGTKGKSWLTSCNGTMISAIGESAVKLVGSFDAYGMNPFRSSKSKPVIWDYWMDDVKNWGTDWYKVKIQVLDGEIKFFYNTSGKWMSAWPEESFTYDEWYNGGYVFLACNSGGTSFRNFKVTNATTKKSVLDKFETWYTVGCDKEKPKKVFTSHYWEADENGVITRKGRDVKKGEDANDGNPYPNMAILYSKKIYKDFTMNLEYKNPAGDRGGAWIGFDGEKGKTWTDKNSGTMWCTCGTNGIKMAGTFTAYNGVKWDSALWDYWLDKADFNARWIKAKLVVKNGEIKYYIKIKGKWKLTWDTADYANPLYYTDWYDGGRIFLAANELGVQYRNIKIKEEKSTNDFSRFNSYYSECVENQPLVKVDPGKYWYEDKGVLIRKNEELGEFQGKEWNLSNYQQNKMAYMFLNGNYVYSDNWQLDVDVTLGNSAWKRFYIGYGATDTVTWRKPNGGTVFWTDDNGGVCMEGNYASNEQIYGDTAESIKNFEKNKAHHYRIVAKAGVVHLYIDGIQVKEYVQQKYQKGGRVFFASNSVNTTFSNISIKTLESDFSQSSWSGYKEYYSSDITKNALTKVQEGTNWAIEDGVIRRKAQEPGMDDCRNYLDMAYLYLNDKKYTNFKLELDYKNGNSGWHRAPIGFGAKMGRHFMEEGGGITALVQPDGYVHFDGNNQSDGAFEEHVFWPVYDEKGNDVSTLKPYDETKWHHMVMEVADGYVTVTVDGFKYVYEMALPSYYNGGYIYLAANSVWAEYKNIKIEDYSEMYNSDDKGWIPKREDIEYDFEYREKEENNSIWSWIYKEL